MTDQQLQDQLESKLDRLKADVQHVLDRINRGLSILENRGDEFELELEYFRGYAHGLDRAIEVLEEYED
jgi:hypothetical protein